MSVPRRNTLTVGTVPILVAPRSLSRKRLIVNNVGTVTVYLAADDSELVSTSFALGAGQAFQTDDVQEQYASVATGTGTVSVWDDC